MPARSSGRSSSLRRRAAASSVVSFDASSTAVHAAVSVSASYYSPLVPASAEHHGQVEEDAEGEEEETGLGGNVDGQVVSLVTGVSVD